MMIHPVDWNKPIISTRGCHAVPLEKTDGGRMVVAVRGPPGVWEVHEVDVFGLSNSICIQNKPEMTRDEAIRHVLEYVEKKIENDFVYDYPFLREAFKKLQTAQGDDP